DSFVEVISACGIWHMTRRVASGGTEGADRFERGALRVTGASFYLLAAGLAVTAAAAAVQGHHPDTTVAGAVIGCISIAGMWLLIRLKLRVGTLLRSQAILADAACTRACLYLSVVLLASSVVYETTGVGLVDAIGTAVIALFALKEGREAFGKAAGKSCGCSGCH
ncbi:MAG TPA: cation transporter, partial [Verrucomicrobiae bacterium]|nr:cation transporter [Verrucomicrobiae bacterium]